jgi:hypothetical protein
VKKITLYHFKAKNRPWQSLRAGQFYHTFGILSIVNFYKNKPENLGKMPRLSDRKKEVEEQISVGWG